MAKRKLTEKPTLAQAKRFEAVARRFAAYRPASAVFTPVRAVRTRFVQFDHATRVGGLPIERFMLMHGVSSHGKTEVALGFEDSFLAADHFVYHVDAERTTPITWIRQLMGVERAAHPLFFGSRPESYEQTIADVRNFLNLVAESKRRGDVPPDTSALVVVDSLRKLVPKDLLKEILDAEREIDAGDVKSGRDRSAQLKAKMNAAWMDELVPLLEHAGAAFIAIAREMENPDAQDWEKKAKLNFKIGGGSAIYYDASLVMRVVRTGYVGQTTKKDGQEQKVVFGERRRIEISKTKVAGKDGKVAVAYAHQSNGLLVPAGFDRARDVLDLAERFGVVELRGASYMHAARGERIGQGEHAAVKALSANEAWLEEVEREVRAKFESVDPVEVDEDGVVAE